VCLQVRDRADRIVATSDLSRTLGALLADPDAMLIAHNARFEVLTTIATCPELLIPWLDALEADRVTCTIVRDKLIEIARGTMSDRSQFDLVSCLDRRKVVHSISLDDKKNPLSPRLRFKELDGLPVSSYPREFADYALGDLAVRDLHAAQDSHALYLADQYRRTRGDVWLGATSAHGMRVDPKAVRTLDRVTEEEIALLQAALQRADAAALGAWGLRQGLDEADIEAMTARAPEALVRLIGSKDTKLAAGRMRAVCASRGLPLTRPKASKKTKTPNPDGVALDADACAASGDLQLRAYARFTSISTVRARLDRLKLAADLGLPIQPSFDVLKKTGRTSARTGDQKDKSAPSLAIGDQTQNYPRLPGLRDCFVAREGCVILSCDWKSAELHTLAQSCVDLGLDSRLAEVLRSGQDVHLWFACQINGWDYGWAAKAIKGSEGPATAKVVKKARQGAKACMFGFPGGLGIATFRAWAAKMYNVILTEAEARELKAIWVREFTEMPAYLREADRAATSGSPLMHRRSDRYRGDLSYTSAANSPFQGGCGDMLIDAGWRIFAWIHREKIPARIWNQAHDEILVEIRRDAASDVTREVVRIMEEVGEYWCPAAPVKAEPALQIHWRKAAEPVYRDGQIIPYEERDLDAGTVEAVRADAKKGLDTVELSWKYAIEETRIQELTCC